MPYEFFAEKSHTQSFHAINQFSVWIYGNKQEWYDWIHLLVNEEHVVINHPVYICNFYKPIFWHYTKSVQYDWVWISI